MRPMEGGDQPVKIPGRIFPARSSRAIPASLVVSPERSVVLADDSTLFPLGDGVQPKFDMPVGRASRRLTLPDGSLFETEDHAAVDALDRGSMGLRLHRAERFRARLGLIAVLCFVGAWAVWRFALPAMVTVAVWLTPAPLEQAIDAGSMQSLDLTFAEPTTLSGEKQDTIQVIFDDLLSELPQDQRDNWDYTLLFRDIPGIGPNAMALPGGTIVITDALVKGFDDEDVIGSVLAHEIGHVVGRHGLQQLYQSLGIYILVALIAGDTGPILEEVLLEGGIVLSLSHSREHEREADDFGIRLAEEAGYDPAGLLRFFAALPDSGETDTDWLSTHPASGERIEAIQNYIDGR